MRYMEHINLAKQKHHIYRHLVFVQKNLYKEKLLTTSLRSIYYNYITKLKKQNKKRYTQIN